MSRRSTHVLAYPEDCRPPPVLARAVGSPPGSEAIERWSRPVGARVLVRLDDGSDWETTTRSEPWLLGDGTAVILLEGSCGGYLLEKVRPA